MILDEYVDVNITSYTYKYYQSLGYEIPMKKSENPNNKSHLRFDPDIKIKVKVSDLKQGSHEIINARCDYCEKTIKRMEYRVYNRITKYNNKYACRKCVLAKEKEYFNDKYGCDWAASTSEFQENRKKTLLSKYGTTNIMDIPGSKEKLEKTNMERYGKQYYTQTEEYKERARTTNQKHLGVDYPTQSDIVKEKIKNVVRNKYGCDHILQNEEIKNKIRNSLYNNKDGVCSKQQKYLCNLYNGELNYPIGGYSGDIVLLNEMIDIEYQGGGHWLNVTLGHMTIEEFNHLEIIRNQYIKKEGYKMIEIVSKKDKLPTDKILLQMLDYSKTYFSDYPNHSWISFNIDEEIVRNAENKDGVLFDYGELRKISKKDLLIA